MFTNSNIFEPLGEVVQVQALTGLYEAPGSIPSYCKMMMMEMMAMVVIIMKGVVYSLRLLQTACVFCALLKAF